MTWVTVAEGTNIEEFEANINPAVEDLPAGTPIVLTLKLPLWAPVGFVGDIAGAEWWAQRFHPEIIVDDVYGDWYTIVIEGRVAGTPVHIVIGVIVSVLALLGFAIASIIVAIKLDANIVEEVTEAMKWIGIGGILLGIAAIIYVARTPRVKEKVLHTVTRGKEAIR